MKPERKETRTRLFEIQTRETETEAGRELWVEGYAVRFDSPTVLFEMDGVEYKEQIARDAFTDCQMEDVIFNYNHGGKVMARTRNHTLQLALDENGLFIRARLDGTAEGRAMYEEIEKGYVDRMSFQFIIKNEAYDREIHMWTVLRIKRLYDVSAVDIPAYEDTSISARKAELTEQQQMLRIRKRKAILRLQLSIQKGENKTW